MIKEIVLYKIETKLCSETFFFLFFNSNFDAYFGIFQCNLTLNKENYMYIKNVMSVQLFKTLKNFSHLLAFFYKNGSGPKKMLIIQIFFQHIHIKHY